MESSYPAAKITSRSNRERKYDHLHDGTSSFKH
uniref:Uncharacterized protein n=1 Tax=Rhizophora mucronata TaxID=61149 RepID=A0A2P2QWW9_RHIMU